MDYSLEIILLGWEATSYHHNHWRLFLECNMENNKTPNNKLRYNWQQWILNQHPQWKEVCHKGWHSERSAILLHQHWYNHWVQHEKWHRWGWWSNWKHQHSLKTLALFFGVGYAGKRTNWRRAGEGQRKVLRGGWLHVVKAVVREQSKEHTKNSLRSIFSQRTARSGVVFVERWNKRKGFCGEGICVGGWREA